MTARRSPRIALSLLCALGLAPAAQAGSISGRLLDSSGTPVAGAAVSWSAYRSPDEAAVDKTAGIESKAQGEVRTDAQGRFRVALEKPGSVSLQIVAAGSPTAVLDGPYEASEETGLDDILLTEVRALKGKVVDDAGRPVAGARVEASPWGMWGSETVLLARATTGEDGAFSLPTAPAGAAVSVRAAGFVPHQQGAADRKTDLRVTLRRGGTIRGVVTDPAGKPAAAAFVMVGSQAVRSGEDGSFSLPGVAAGAQSVGAIWREDYVARKDGVRVRKGEISEATIRLAKAASISGTVIEEGTRKAVAGARVAADLTGGFGQGRFARTDARGRFRIPGLPSNRYAVEASKQDWLTSRLEGVATTVSAPGTAAIALRKAAGISGKVSDEQGKPVAGARVRLAREGGVRAMLRASSAREAFGEGRSAVSGPDGTFHLRGLSPAKNATLEAEREGYVTTKQHGLQLKSAETVKGVALTMRRGIEAKGRVVDAGAAPVAGAELRATKRQSGGNRMIMITMGRPDRRADATTGNDGTFLLRGLEAGEFTVAVSREGYATKTLPSVEIRSEGDNVLSDVVLQAGEAIAGLVRGADGNPVTGARVYAWGDASGSRDASTDGEGRFRLDGLSGGRPVRMSVMADGFARLEKEVTPPSNDLVLVLKTGGTIRGRVEDAESKKPVTEFTAGYTATANIGGGGMMSFRFGGADGDNSFQSPDGSFELTNVPSGKWAVQAGAAGYRPGVVADIDVGEGETKEGVVVPLRKGGVLTGRVLDPRRGTGLPNASVSWQEAGSPSAGFGAMAGRFGGGGENSATTDADGKFQFDGLPEGKITVAATHADFVEASRTVDVADAATVEITLGTGGAIAGNVLGTDGRSGIAGAEVALQIQGSAMFSTDQVRTDASGAFLFENLKAGRYKVSAQSSGGVAEAREVVLAENQRVDGVVLGLASGATIRGTIAGLPVNRLGGIRVSVSSDDFQASATSDDTGAFTVRDVPPGVYRLLAYTVMVGSRVQKSLEVPAGATEVPVEILFEGSGRIAGRVTRSGTGVGQLFVQATPDPPGASSVRASARTDDEGSYALEGLPDGNYEITVNGLGVNHRKVLAVQGDTPGDIELPSVGLTGFVTDTASGEPIEGATVQVESGAETSAWGIKRASSDSRGYYAVDGLDAGAWQVSARKDGYQAKSQTLTLGSSSAELNLALARGSGLAIQAVDAQTGLPMRMVYLLAFAANGSVAHQGFVSLDNEGRGELAALAPGRYSIYAFAEGYAPRNIPSVTVPAGALNLGFTLGGAVEIRSAAPGSARILDASGAIYMARWGRLDGQLVLSPPVTRIDHLAPGSYRLVTAGGQESFTVAEGQTTTVEAR